jgi:hypothetical protein
LGLLAIESPQSGVAPHGERHAVARSGEGGRSGDVRRRNAAGGTTASGSVEPRRHGASFLRLLMLLHQLIPCVRSLWYGVRVNRRNRGYAMSCRWHRLHPRAVVRHYAAHSIKRFAATCRSLNSGRPPLAPGANRALTELRYGGRAEREELDIAGVVYHNAVSMFRSSVRVDSTSKWMSIPENHIS